MSTPPASLPCSRRSVRVLYADDVPELRDLVRIVLAGEGHSVECEADGVRALDTFSRTSDYDLVITDHHMPRMDGIELVLNLRRRGFEGKIMVFSSDLNPMLTAEYKDLRVDRILAKPIYPSFLRQLLAELFPAEPATPPTPA